MVRITRLVPAVLLAMTPACVINRLVVPADYLAQASPGEMLVVDTAGRQWLLEEPGIVGDSVVGFRAGTSYKVSVAVDEVQEARVRQKSPARTALLIGVFVAAAGGAVMAASSGGTGEPCKLIWDVDIEILGARSQCDALGPDGGPVQPTTYPTTR